MDRKTQRSDLQYNLPRLALQHKDPAVVFSSEQHVQVHHYSRGSRVHVPRAAVIDQ